MTQRLIGIEDARGDASVIRSWGCWPRACLRGIGRALLALSQSRLGKSVGVVLGLSWGATGFLLGSVFFGTPGGIV